MTDISDSRLANLAADAIKRGFDDYRTRFRIVTRRAPVRFAERDWAGGQRDAVERLDLYNSSIAGIVDDIRSLLGPRADDSLIWVSIKAVYSSLIGGSDDWELAETYFNSVTRRIFDTVGVNPSIEFVATDYDTPPTRSRRPVQRTYEASTTIEAMLSEILADFDIALADSEQIGAAADRIRKRIDELGAVRTVDRAEMAGTPFYRGQALYLIGRLLVGAHLLPMVLAFEHGEDGLEIDAVLLTEDLVSVLFSFTRSYFHVEVDRPHDLVLFLSSLMPRKRPAEIYISIGMDRHGKTERYRDLLRHLAQTDAQFEHARGKVGLVMIVFTLPGHDDVFKVIRDRFPPQKQTTRRAVMDQYRKVFRHDRAGRLIDAQSYEHLEFDADRFAPKLLEELKSEAGDSVSIMGDQVVIHHVYVERRVTPLDIYVREAAATAAQEAVRDFGQAIKDMAYTDVFPGDLLTKNFGVTRHGRVVFYDYDELSDLMSLRFRRVPEPRTIEEEMASEPWYSVAPNDIFPEELRPFLGLSPELARIFDDEHGELFDAAHWTAIQARLGEGEMIKIYPYGNGVRIL